MSELSPGQRQRIEAAVSAAEKRTSAEFAVVVARSADDYATFPLLWAGFLTLLTAGGIAAVTPGLSAGMSFAVQAGVFITVAAALHLSDLRTRLVPAALKRDYAARLARLQFAALINERTADDAGLLLFVSLAEKHVEILADNGITARVPQTEFQEIIDQFIQQVRTEKIEAGLTGAIEACALLLARHFPPRIAEPDEIPNQIIEI